MWGDDVNWQPMTTSSIPAPSALRRHSPAPDRQAPLSPPRILVFDSGVGGLSVLQAVRARLPGCDYFYACDNAAFPYGTKDEDTLVVRVEQVLKTVIAQTHPDVVVVACNTASTLVLPRIRSHFHDPVVGVVPAIKPAAAASRTGVFGLLGTPGTVARAYTQNLIDEFAPQCTVVRVGGAALVEMAEAKLRGATVDRDQIAAILAPLFVHPALDTVVLACTHFPLLHDELVAAAPRPVIWIDSGEAIARRVASLVPAMAADCTPVAARVRTAIFTARNADISLLEPTLSALGCEHIDYVLI